MEADAPVDEVDALADTYRADRRARRRDDATYGNDQWGLGAVLKQLIKSADVEGVRNHLELIDYHDEAVSAPPLGPAARLQYVPVRRREPTQRGARCCCCSSRRATSVARSGNAS